MRLTRPILVCDVRIRCGDCTRCSWRRLRWCLRPRQRLSSLADRARELGRGRDVAIGARAGRLSTARPVRHAIERLCARRPAGPGQRRRSPRRSRPAARYRAAILPTRLATAAIGAHRPGRLAVHACEGAEAGHPEPQHPRHGTPLVVSMPGWHRRPAGHFDPERRLTRSSTSGDWRRGSSDLGQPRHAGSSRARTDRRRASGDGVGTSSGLGHIDEREGRRRRRPHRLGRRRWRSRITSRTGELHDLFVRRRRPGRRAAAARVRCEPALARAARSRRPIASCSPPLDAGLDCRVGDRAAQRAGPVQADHRRDRRA